MTKVLLNLKSTIAFVKPTFVLRVSAYTYLALDTIFVGVWKYATVINFIILGLGNRVMVSIKVRVRDSIWVGVSSIRLIRYSVI